MPKLKLFSVCGCRFMAPLFLLSIFICQPDFAQAQDTGRVIFTVSPAGSWVKIAGQTLELDRDSLSQGWELPAGKHELVIWSPYFEDFRDSVQVVAGETVDYAKGLVTQRPEFEQYNAELKAYEHSEFKRYGKTALLIAGNGLLLWYSLDGTSIKKLKDKRDEAESWRQQYVSNVDENAVVNARENFERTRSEYDDTRKKLNTKRLIGLPVFAVTSLISWKYIRKMHARRPVKPVYQGREPFTLTEFGLDGVTLAGLKLSFSF